MSISLLHHASRMREYIPFQVHSLRKATRGLDSAFFLCYIERAMNVNMDALRRPRAVIEFVLHMVVSRF